MAESTKAFEGQYRVGRARSWGYGLGDFGINLYFMSAMTYLTYFYTDVFGLSPESVVLLLFVARLVDAFTDPIMGLVIDKTQSRWGAMRPYLLFGPIPMGLLLVLTFTVPEGSDSYKLVWAYATYILFGIAYTVVGLPYASLTARLTNDYDERTTLSTIRMACAFTGGLVVSVSTLWLVGLWDSEAEGFRNTMVLFAVVATLFLWVSFAATQERIAAPLKAAAPTTFKPVTHNPHLWVVIGIFCIGMLGFTVRSAATPYYFKYFVNRPDLIGTYFLVTLSVMVLGLVLVPRIAQTLGKTRTLYVGAVITCLGCGLLYLMPPDAVVGIFLAGSVISLGATPVAVLGWAMIADTVEYAQWRHGERADGLIYSTASFVQKLAKMVGGAGVAGMLAVSGYVANTVQEDATVEALVGMMTWVPALIALPLVLFAGIHSLDETTHRKIVAELAEREGEAASPGSA